MDVIYFLIPLALILLAVAISAFVWAVRSGQFDNLDREAYRILFDEDMVDQPSAEQDKPPHPKTPSPPSSPGSRSQEKP